MTSELGVTSSNKCGPVPTNGPIIDFTGRNITVTPAEAAASSYHLQMVSFVDGDLQQISNGFPRELNDTVCLECVNSNDQQTHLLSGCKVTYITPYPAGKMLVGVERTTDAFRSITVGFNTTDGSRNFSGFGDLTNSSRNCAMFLFSKDDHINARFTYLEYANQDHCRTLLVSSRNTSGKLWNATEGTVWTARVACDKTRIKPEDLERSFQAYRSMQLERNTQMSSFDKIKQLFEKFREDDVYRAALSVLVMEDYNKSGEYYVYTECGRYMFSWMAPLIVCIVIIIVLRVLSWYVSSRNSDIDVPFNSDSWYREALRNQMPLRTVRDGDRGGYKKFFWCNNNDEMVLVGDGPNAQIRIDVHDDTEIFGDVGAGPSSSVHDVSIAMEQFQNREESIARQQRPALLETNTEYTASPDVLSTSRSRRNYADLLH